MIGNVSAKQLRAVDPNLPALIRDQVEKAGTGLIMIGGDASFAGVNERPLDTGWGGSEIEGLLPVTLKSPSGVPDALFSGDNRRFQTVPTDRGLQYLMKVGPTEAASKELWDKLNAIAPGRTPNRLTAISKIGDPKPGAVVYAVASENRDAIPAGLRVDQAKPPYLLVGWETGGSGKGCVLAFAGYDTYLWRPFGRRNQPPTNEGMDIHAQFWKRVILWLARQDESDGAAYARPEFPPIADSREAVDRGGLALAGGGRACRREAGGENRSAGPDARTGRNVPVAVRQRWQTPRRF